jgi:hypothetical protein
MHHLAVYDTATRVGAFLRLQPKRVYLHAGTRQGARALGFRKRESLSARELPKALRRLSPDEIEDCLCIYKSQVAAIVDRGTTARPERSCDMR